MSIPHFRTSFFLVSLLLCGSAGSVATSASIEKPLPTAQSAQPKEQRKGDVNGVLYQAYHWYTAADGRLWEQLTSQAQTLSDKGFTALWLPPAYKGFDGPNDVGYGVYDLYDLGEFNQRGAKRTKYGDKDQYLKLINTAHAAGLDVFGDIVLNHRLGGEKNESVSAVEVDPNNRLRDIKPARNILAWTIFEFPGRADKYSSFHWNAEHFSGVDWDQSVRQPGHIYRFLGNGKHWATEVSTERGNYDYLLGADVDYGNSEAAEEMKNWGTWYQDFAQLDGFRLDAAKHIQKSYVREWLEHVRAESGKELFAVAEYWDYTADPLLAYLKDQPLSLFDVPLHMNFFNAGKAQGQYDMARILDNTLMQRAPTQAVTFVENHDTQPRQALESPVADWFKPLAYALILLRSEGYPSVFAADYQGATYDNVRIPAINDTLDVLLAARRDLAYGPQRSYFDAPDVVGWTRSGDAKHKAGLAVVLSDNEGGVKRMEVGKEFANVCFKNLVKSALPCVTIDRDGFGNFPVDGRSFAVWSGLRATKE